MTTLASRIGNLLPRAVFERLQPLYHFAREILHLYRLGGRLRRSRDLSNWIAERPMGPGRKVMPVVVRSYRELRRVVQFGLDPADVVHSWMHQITSCKTLYDVGSANGLEGFLTHHLHNAHIVFIEPYTPSIESILKTSYVVAQRGSSTRSFDIVHAGCDEKESYDRLYMHGVPRPGETLNSFSDLEDYCRGGRAGEAVFVSQWLKGVTLDSLHYVYGLPAPTHVKIDIDGFEARAIRGARQLLANRVVESWAIEITGDQNLEEIAASMRDAGYTEVARWEHYPGTMPRTFDIIYKRS